MTSTNPTTAEARNGGAPAEAAGRYPVEAGVRAEEESAAQSRTKAEMKHDNLMEAVVERGNLWLAYDRVLKNKGSAGVDGIGRDQFKAHLQRHWPTIRARLLAGDYGPQPIQIGRAHV